VKTVTKKLAVSILLLSGTVPLLFVIYFFAQQQILRHRMNGKLEEMHLQSVTLNNNDILWIEMGKECMINGHLFDVRSMNVVDGVTTIKGLYDEDETMLKERFDHAWGKNMSDQQSLLVKLFQCLNSLYCNSGTIENSTFTYPNLHLPSLSIDLPEWTDNILTPPPQA